MGKTNKGDSDDQLMHLSSQTSSPTDKSPTRRATVSVITQDQLGLESQLFTMDSPKGNGSCNPEGSKGPSDDLTSPIITNNMPNTPSSGTSQILPEEPPEDASDSVKLNYIMSLLRGMPIIEERVRNMQHSLNTSTHEVKGIQSCMSSKCQFIEARCAMLEDCMRKMEQRMEDLECHQMKQNVMIYNLPYTQGEVPKDVVLDFFATQMKIPNRELANIKIDVAHRVGRANQRGPPRMVAKMLTLDSQLSLMKYAINLKGSNFSISVQLPKTTQERRSAQLGLLKQERQNNPTEKCRLVKDRLFVGKQEINPQFERRPLVPKAGQNLHEVTVKSSNEIIEKGSKFQAHAVAVTTDGDVSQGLAAVVKDHARASHRVYAYRYPDPSSGTVISGHSDDGEWGASRFILEELNQSSASCLVVITRYHGGINLGRRRFELYQQAARAAAPAAPQE